VEQIGDQDAKLHGTLIARRFKATHSAVALTNLSRQLPKQSITSSLSDTPAMETSSSFLCPYHPPISAAYGSKGLGP
jgi:hypothetical protein